MTPRWNILIATLAQRQDRFLRLLNELMPQVARYEGYVLVTAFWNRGEYSLGEIRQDLVTASDATYVSFVDDDDSVPPYHVEEVMKRLGRGDEGVDYVGWQMQCYSDGTPLKPTFHSLRYRGWYDDDQGYYRDVSHLNPIRRELALRADFRLGEPPEDVSWVDQVRGHVRTEEYVDRVMYHYYSSSADSTWRGVTVDSQWRRPIVGHPHFTFHPRSSP